MSREMSRHSSFTSKRKSSTSMHLLSLRSSLEDEDSEAKSGSFLTVANFVNLVIYLQNIFMINL